MRQRQGLLRIVWPRRTLTTWDRHAAIQGLGKTYASVQKWVGPPEDFCYKFQKHAKHGTVAHDTETFFDGRRVEKITRFSKAYSEVTGETLGHAFNVDGLRKSSANWLLKFVPTLGRRVVGMNKTARCHTSQERCVYEHEQSRVQKIRKKKITHNDTFELEGEERRADKRSNSENPGLGSATLSSSY